MLELQLVRRLGLQLLLLRQLELLPELLRLPELLQELLVRLLEPLVVRQPEYLLLPLEA